jgi:hypothetical protein
MKIENLFHFVFERNPWKPWWQNAIGYLMLAPVVILAATWFGLFLCRLGLKKISQIALNQGEP